MQVVVVAAIYLLRSMAEKSHGDIVRPRRGATRDSIADNERRDPLAGKELYFRPSEFVAMVLEFDHFPKTLGRARDFARIPRAARIRASL
jgi:hypothetical protein